MIQAKFKSNFVLIEKNKQEYHTVLEITNKSNRD